MPNEILEKENSPELIRIKQISGLLDKIEQKIIEKGFLVGEDYQDLQGDEEKIISLAEKIATIFPMRTQKEIEVLEEDELQDSKFNRSNDLLATLVYALASYSSNDITTDRFLLWTEHDEEMPDTDGLENLESTDVPDSGQIRKASADCKLPTLFLTRLLNRANIPNSLEYSYDSLHPSIIFNVNGRKIRGDYFIGGFDYEDQIDDENTESKRIATTPENELIMAMESIYFVSQGYLAILRSLKNNSEIATTIESWRKKMKVYLEYIAENYKVRYEKIMHFTGELLRREGIDGEVINPFILD